MKSFNLILTSLNVKVWILDTLVACIKEGKPGYGFPVWNLAMGHVSHSLIQFICYFDYVFDPQWLQARRHFSKITSVDKELFFGGGLFAVKTIFLGPI